ncbi:MAG: FMN-binding negative transcriptional regulator [Tabrizicola sp.]
MSPDWYGSHADVPDQAPTRNHVAVHLRGMLKPLPEDALRPHIDALSADDERSIKNKRPWTSARMTEGAMPRIMRSGPGCAVVRPGALWHRPTRLQRQACHEDPPPLRNIDRA